MTTLAMNLNNQAISQYTNFDYDSMGLLSDTPIGLNENGIQKLEQDSNEGAAILAYFTTGYEDFGRPNQKRIRSFLLGGEANDSVTVTVSTDDGTDSNTFTATFDQDELKLSGSKAFSKRSQKARYYQFKIANVSGGQFSIDSLTVVPVVLHTKPSGVGV